MKLKLPAGLALVMLLDVGSAAAQSYTAFDVPDSFPGSTYAYGISGSNVVGWYYNTAGNGYYGYLYDGAAFTTLSVPGSQNGTTTAYGIDGANIVGSYYASSMFHGFLYDGTTYTTLNAPSAIYSTIAQGISGSNIVGQYTSDSTHGFLYNGSSWTTLDAPGSVQTVAAGVDGNNIVGNYTDDSTFQIHGFLYDGSTWITLNDPLAASNDGPGSHAYGTYATGISGNNIVGYYGNGTTYQGFLYDGSTYTTITEPSATMATQVYGISGTNIVGTYSVSGAGGSAPDGGGSHGFTSTVPEPSAWALMAVGLGLGGSVFLRNRRRDALGPRFRRARRESR